MADRIFALIVLAVAGAYAFIAFTIIRAPFQYDPLGPETWPQILGVVACLCAGWILLRPEVRTLAVARATWVRLVALVALLFGYAWAFQKTGFVVSTFGFCLALSLMLGARIGRALVFAVVTAVAGYLVATGLLELNLPAGPLAIWDRIAALGGG